VCISVLTPGHQPGFYEAWARGRALCAGSPSYVHTSVLLAHSGRALRCPVCICVWEKQRERLCVCVCVDAHERRCGWLPFYYLSLNARWLCTHLRGPTYVDPHNHTACTPCCTETYIINVRICALVRTNVQMHQRVRTNAPMCAHIRVYVHICTYVRAHYKFSYALSH